MARYNRPEIHDFLDMMDLSEKEALVECLQKSIAEEKSRPPKSQIQEQWDEIKRLVKYLQFEPYIDDQWEIEEIWDLCREIAASSELKDEPWSRRKEMLSYIIDGDYYGNISADEGMRDLFFALCFSPEEKRECADMAFRHGIGAVLSDAAKLYKECGLPEKYYEHLERLLGRDEKPYLELIGYYRYSDPEKAAAIAEAGLKKCDTQTELMLHLLQKAKQDGDEQRFSRLMQGARRRRAVDFDAVQTALMEN